MTPFSHFDRARSGGGFGFGFEASHGLGVGLVATDLHGVFARGIDARLETVPCARTV